MSDNDSRPLHSRPAVHLLDELESIKDVLGDDLDDDLQIDIPLLDDMVVDHLDDNAKLLNIKQIFDEDVNTDETPSAVEPPMQFPRFTLDVAISDAAEIVTPTPRAEPIATPRPRVRPDYSREVLIQELVDEFIPQIEAELHKRLQQLDDGALQRLKDST